MKKSVKVIKREKKSNEKSKKKVVEQVNITMKIIKVMVIQHKYFKQLYNSYEVWIWIDFNIKLHMIRTIFSIHLISLSIHHSAHIRW